MNSVKLANNIWEQIRQWTFLPGDDRLVDLVNDEAGDSPDFVKDNALRRLKTRLKNYREAFARFQKDRDNQQVLKELGELSTKRID